MRISIRAQLAIVLVLSSAVGLATLAIATWVTNHDFVLNVAASRLRTTAVLKSAQIAFNLELMQTAATFLTTRTIIQQALERYNNGSNTTPQNWETAISDLRATLGNVGPLTNPLVLQASVFSVNTSGPAGNSSVLNGTGTFEPIRLPYDDAQGQAVYLGSQGSGYPPALYPNLTISNSSLGYTANYNGESLGLGSTLILGPLSVNATFSLLSFTLPIVGNDNNTEILGWATVLGNARLIQLVQQDQRGLGLTGETLLLGPTNTTNNFPDGILGNEEGAATAEVRYLLPLNATSKDRHPGHIIGTENPPFQASRYPAVERALVEDSRGINDVNSILRTHNEANVSVSTGYSMVPSDLVDWVVVVEQARSEVWEPIDRLRKIILACLFAIIAFWMIVSFPLAHWAVLPIIRLRAASEQTIDPPTRGNSSQESSSGLSQSCNKFDAKSSCSKSVHGKRMFVIEKIARWRGKRRGGLHIEQRDDQRFRIPGKVPEKKKVWIKDEMTDLIRTFNEMSDELYLQYSKLEERVRQRTIELEHSKKAAEAANESKTVFVANVSHELKTPLNGILGMCAVCMEESDPSKLKQSLGIIYKSGDLLLRTLTDLLTFSTNQVGLQVLKLDEKEFYLRDVESQVTALFGEMARERGINLAVSYQDAPQERYGTPDQPPLKDMALWGDVHRILQMVINFTSNALKFTPAGGSVTVTVRTIAEIPQRHRSDAGRTIQFPDRQSTNQATPSPNIDGTANFINPREPRHDQAPAPPPGNDICIEIDVQDTGPGIPEAQQRSIFEPFVQADAGLSRKHSGTGLGLSICSQLASLMRGTIGLSSTVGVGSTFTTRLPLRRITGSTRSSRELSRNNSHSVPPTGDWPRERVPTMAAMTAQHSIKPLTAPQGKAEAPPLTSTPSSQARAIGKAGKDIKADKEAHHDFSKVRILVAEDNKVNQEVITRMLKLEKIFDVTVAADGQQALDLVKTNTPSAEVATDSTGDDSSTLVEDSRATPYDLIFMDCQMPVMDGLTSTRLIRQYGYTGPIVALTAYAEQSNVDDCYQAGMDYFLAKPIKRPLLKKVLTDYCSPPPTAIGGVESNGTANGHSSRGQGQSPISPDSSAKGATSQTRRSNEAIEMQSLEKSQSTEPPATQPEKT